MSQAKVTEYFQSRKKNYDSQPLKRRKVDVSKCPIECDVEKTELLKFDGKNSNIGLVLLNPKSTGLNLVSTLTKKKTIAKTPKRLASKSETLINRSATHTISKKRKLALSKEVPGEMKITEFLVSSQNNSVIHKNITPINPSVRRNLVEDLNKQNDFELTAEQDLKSTKNVNEDLVVDIQNVPEKANGTKLDSSNKIVTGITPVNLFNVPGTMKNLSKPSEADSITKSPTKKTSLIELKKKLKVCGKLSELQQCLAKIGEGSSKVKNLHEHRLNLMKSLSPIKKSPKKISSAVSLGSSPDDAKTQLGSIELPAYQRFHNLTSKESSSNLTLPYKYKTLAEYFRCVDTVTSILYNRQEVCTFDKLKNGVQEMMKRAFDKIKLGQIKSVFPLAYILQLEKGISSFISNKTKRQEYTLTVTPNFDYNLPELSNGLNDINLIANKPKSVTKLMNPSCLLERRQIFTKNLIEITKKHHEVFLSGLNPPLSVPHKDIIRWHPKFPVDSVPDISMSNIPEPPENKVSTAKDVLDKVKGITSERIERALQNVADKHNSMKCETSPVPSTKPKKSVITTGVLKGISQSFLDKIRAKESEIMAKEMLRRPESEKKLEMMARLPEFISILRAYFITERRAALHIDDASAKLTESCKSALGLEEATDHIRLISTLLPDWLFLISISKGIYVKIDKTKELSVLLKRIETCVKLEKQV